MAFTEQQRNALFHPIRWFFNPEPEEPDGIPRKELSLYALGFMGQSHVTSMAGGNWFFHFCTNVLKISPGTVGKMTGLTMAFDALNDPMAGALIDTHRFKDGRKLLPWIKYMAPLTAVVSFLLFINWNFRAMGTTIFYATAIYVTWDVLFSFQDTAMWGMTATISPLSSQRARAIQWADNGGFLGSLLPGLILPMLSGNGAFGLTQRQVYFMFSLVLCLGGGFQALLALNAKERVRSLPTEPGSMEPGSKELGSREKNALFRNIGALRHNHILLLFLASELLRACCPIVTDPYIFQQLTYRIGGKTISAGVLVTLFAMISGLPGTAMKFIATKIADRVGGMKRILIIALIAEAATRVLRSFIGIGTIPRLALVYLLDSISYLPNSIFGIAQRSMISDSVDYVEWKTGQRTEGLTMSVRNLTGKMNSAIKRYAQGLTLVFLQFDADRVEQNQQQNAHFQKWVWPMFMLGPALGLLFALIPLLLLKYPDTLKMRVETEMAQRRAIARENTEENA